MANPKEEEDRFFLEMDESRSHRTNVESFYDSWAKTGGYDKLMKVTLGTINKYTAQAMSQYFTSKRDIKILDVACGTGITGAELKDVCFETIDGTDLTEGMLEVAKTKNVYQNLFIGCISDTSKLDISDSTYDGVICACAITVGHLEFRYAFKEFVRVAKPNGIIAFTMNLSTPMTEILELLGNFISEGKVELKSLERRFYFQRGDESHDCHVCIVKKL